MVMMQHHREVKQVKGCVRTGGSERWPFFFPLLLPAVTTSSPSRAMSACATDASDAANSSAAASASAPCSSGTTTADSSVSSAFASLDHLHWMRAALAEAESALLQEEVPVGCVVVHAPTQRMIAAGRNETNRTKNVGGVRAHATQTAPWQRSGWRAAVRADRSASSASHAIRLCVAAVPCLSDALQGTRHCEFVCIDSISNNDDTTIRHVDFAGQSVGGGMRIGARSRRACAWTWQLFKV